MSAKSPENHNYNENNSSQIFCEITWNFSFISKKETLQNKVLFLPTFFIDISILTHLDNDNSNTIFAYMLVF